ncbi:hypothetical protein HanPI659440_Chr09g0332421 [Helianthus annuus]|nr:hypothetical protein HanPI659440_Chr09g0332421 [Helianthus annuus]
MDGLAEEAPLWRMFCDDFEGKIELVRCGSGEEGWKRTIISNFWMPDEAALNAVLPEGKGDLGDLGDPAATGVPKETVGLGVPDGSAATGASTTGTKPVDDKKQKAAASVAGVEKAPMFRKTRATAVPKTKPAATTAPSEEPVSMFAAPPSSPKVVDVETQKKGDENPSIEVQLEREKAAFEKLKQTERWAASAGLKQVRSLAKLLSDERKIWKDACDRENEKLFRVRQELNNLKAANAALVKEKAAAEAAVKEAETRGATALKEAEARAAQELADANADRITLNKVAEVQNRVTILEEVSSRATEAEVQANRAAEARDGLTTSLGQVTVDHAWMREHVIEHIVETILDAPENATAVAEMKSVHVRLGSRLVTTNALAM